MTAYVVTMLGLIFVMQVVVSLQVDALRDLLVLWFQEQKRRKG